MPSITEEEQKLPDSPEDRPISGDGCCELCLYNIPRGSMMVILPGIILLLCGGLTLLVTESSSGSGSWTSVTSLSILIVGAIITVIGVLFCTKMWCKYRPKKKRPPADGVKRNDPVSLVAVYKIRHEGHDNPGFVSDSQAQRTYNKPGKPGAVTQQPPSYSQAKHKSSHSAQKQTISNTDNVDASSKQSDFIKRGVYPELSPQRQEKPSADKNDLAPPEGTKDGALPQEGYGRADDSTPVKDRPGFGEKVHQSHDSPADSAIGGDTSRELETSFTQEEVEFREEGIDSRKTETSEVI